MDKKAHSPLVESVLCLIEKDFPFLEGVEGLAEQLGVSKYHLIRAFGREVGLSPGVYLQRRKLKAACLLLAGRSYPVEAVAKMIGFSSSSYFGKVFRKTYGKSPVEYRLSQQGKELTWEEELETQKLESIFHL